MRPPLDALHVFGWAFFPLSHKGGPGRHVALPQPRWPKAKQHQAIRSLWLCGIFGLQLGGYNEFSIGPTT